MEGFSINRVRKQKTEYFTGFDKFKIGENDTSVNGIFIHEVVSQIISNTE